MQRDVQLFWTFPLKMTRKESCLCLKGKYYLKSAECCQRMPPPSLPPLPSPETLITREWTLFNWGKSKNVLEMGGKRNKGSWFGTAGLIFFTLSIIHVLQLNALRNLSYSLLKRLLLTNANKAVYYKAFNWDENIQ